VLGSGKGVNKLTSYLYVGKEGDVEIDGKMAGKVIGTAMVTVTFLTGHRGDRFHFHPFVIMPPFGRRVQGKWLYASRKRGLYMLLDS